VIFATPDVEFLFTATPGVAAKSAATTRVGVNPQIRWRVKKQMRKAEDFILQQNHSNPFNSTTPIDFDRSRPVWVQMTIYSFTGQPIAMLANERQSTS